VIYIAYHENIASSTDPFYLANPGENLARLNYYGVTGSPWVGLDGGMLSLGVFGWDSEQAYPILHDSTVVRATPSPPLTITVEAEPVGSDYHLRAGIYASAPPGPGTYKLHVVVVEKEPTGPPGIEGQTIYPWAMRDMIPTSSGTTFTITNGDLVNYEFEVPLNPAWDLDELGVVVFVQRNDKAVIQSGSTFE
jgi:hypothetical protein